MRTADNPRLILDSVVLGVVGGLSAQLFMAPAHRDEYVQLSLQLLEAGKVNLPPQVTHLHLAELLQSGMTFDLPDGFQLSSGALRPESPWVGKTIAASSLHTALPAARIAAILRGMSAVVPQANTVLQPSDRLLVIAPQSAREQPAENLAPPSELAEQAEGANGAG